jgi:hypothetical protein
MVQEEDGRSQGRRGGVPLPPANGDVVAERRVIMKKTARAGYDLARMKESVEGPSSNVALTLSGPMEFRDVLGAFKMAYQGMQERERAEGGG